jgi:transcriptional regulator with XRE-family HTH domain
MAGREFPAYGIALRRARAERRWSRPRLAYELERVIRHEGKEPPERDSLIRMLRAWENGEHRPDDLNRQRLAEVLGPILDEDVKIIQPDLTAASAPPSSRELKTSEFVAWIAEHSALSFQEAYEAVVARAAWIEAQAPSVRHADAYRRSRVARQQVAEAVVAYYGDDVDGRSRFYRAHVGGASLTLSILVQPGGLGAAVQLGGDQEQFQFSAQDAHLPVAPLQAAALEAALMRLASVEVSNTVLVNTPLYRLLDIDIARHRLEGVVNLADFARYALTMDLLETELTGALAAAVPQRAGDGVVSAEVAAQLPLRDRYLPGLAPTLALDQRLCVGGPVALFAAARRSSRGGHHERDYVLLIQERSARVLNVTGKLAVVPKCFHEPTVEIGQEVRLSASLERELEEELLGRQDLEGLTIGSQRQADPFHEDRLSQPMRWLLDRRDTGAYRVECTGFGINMVSGNYEFPCLILIDDDEWWERYGGRVEANWEMERIRRYSSLDAAGIQALILDPRWSNEGLFAFLEGLRRLGELGNLSRLALPTIEVQVDG